MKRVTEPYHIPIMVNRGYSSTTAMFDSYRRFRNAFLNDQEVKVLYLGDFDPSGIDMIQDIKNRIDEFMIGGDEVENFEFKIEPIALIESQIKKYNPPPNPIKMNRPDKKNDPRARKFARIYGTSCWEVDALRPEVLDSILEKSIKKNMDFEIFNKILKKEEEDKEKLRSLEDYLED